jgi:hypothetical protein
VQTPFCVTVTVLPATVSVPVRLVVEKFVPMENAVEPLPVPDDPLVIVSHDALDVAVQGHPLPAVTDTEDVDAADAVVTFVGETDGAHAPLWVIVSVTPATVIVPVRADVLPFAATE